MYRLRISKEAGNDVDRLAAYMLYSLKNEQASNHFLQQYYKQAQNLTLFPFGYREIGIKYQGYHIRIKPFLSYNIFSVVDSRKQQITILRVLKDRQNWNNILHSEDVYSF